MKKNDHIGAIIVGAGQSRRMGEPKLLKSLHGQPLFKYPLHVAKTVGLSPIIFVAGQHIVSFKQHMTKHEQIDWLYNPDYAMGMAHSLKLGIKNIQNKSEAAIIFLADQPLISPTVVQSLINAYNRMKTKDIYIIRPSYQGQHGHPILFSRKLFPEFELLQGDRGGKEIIKKYRNNLHVIHFDSYMLGKDVDTQEDLQLFEHYFNKL